MEEINLSGARDACLIVHKYFQPQYTGKCLSASSEDSPLLAALCSKPTMGWSVLLLSGEEQRSPCLIPGTSDLLIAGSPQSQLCQHHLPGMWASSRQRVNRYEVEPAAMGPWQLREQLLPFKAAQSTKQKRCTGKN